MIAAIHESILTPATGLWVVAAVIAAGILFGAINRRRTHLTESLREFVDENKLDATPSAASLSEQVLARHGDLLSEDPNNPASGNPASSNPASGNPASGNPASSEPESRDPALSGDDDK